MALGFNPLSSIHKPMVNQIKYEKNYLQYSYWLLISEKAQPQNVASSINTKGGFP